MCLDSKLGGTDPGQGSPARDGTPGQTGKSGFAEACLEPRLLEEYSGRAIAAALWRKLLRRKLCVEITYYFIINSAVIPAQFPVIYKFG